MSATIKDLAKIAGVTNQTISNVFNRPELVKDSTRKRIHALAREMGYRPNVAARSLRMGLRPSVGLMVASHSPIEIENIFQSDSKLLAQLCLQCEQQDLNLVLGLMQQVVTPASDWDALPRMMENAHVGPVICLKDMWDELATVLRNYKIPAIVIDGPACGLAAVQTDEAGSVEMLVDHLVSLGHQRIAFCNGGRPDLPRSGYRDVHFPQGYLKALTRYRLSPYPGWDRPLVDAGETIEELFSLDAAPTAIIGYDEGHVVALTDALNKRGLRVPQDVSLVAAQEIGATNFVTTPITGIARPYQILAELTVQWIRDELTGNGPAEPAVVQLPAELIIGATSAPVKGGVKKARKPRSLKGK